MHILAKTLLISLAATAAFAEDVYQWVDENGVTNYTQQRPKIGVEYSRVRTNVAGAALEIQEPEPAPAQRPKLTSEQKAMLDDLKAAETARQAEVAKIREANCEKSRLVLQRLTEKERIRVRDNDGTERVMGEDERQNRISQAQEGVASNCEPTT